MMNRRTLPRDVPGSNTNAAFHLGNSQVAACAVVPRRFTGKSVVAGVRLTTDSPVTGYLLLTSS